MNQIIGAKLFENHNFQLNVDSFVTYLFNMIRTNTFRQRASAPLRREDGHWIVVLSYTFALRDAEGNDRKETIL